MQQSISAVQIVSCTGEISQSAPPAKTTISLPGIIYHCHFLCSTYPIVFSYLFSLALFWFRHRCPSLAHIYVYLPHRLSSTFFLSSYLDKLSWFLQRAKNLSGQRVCYVRVLVCLIDKCVLCTKAHGFFV